MDKFCENILLSKEEKGYTWNDVADICNKALGWNKSPNAYRMMRRTLANPVYDTFDDADIEEETPEEILEQIKLERIKARDERTQANALYRRVAREDTIKEIANDVASKFNKTLLLDGVDAIEENENGRCATLVLSDWHYGIEINNFWNIYTPDIAKQRIKQLELKVIKLLDLYNINELNIVNLGDLISGRIHNTIRLNNRIDVITQTIEVSEILAELITNLSKYAVIHYYDTLDNHSRLEPNLSDSLDLESLTRIITEFLKVRLENNPNVNIHNNIYSDDIVTFNIFDWKIGAVHGHHDKPSKVINNLSMLTKEKFDLILTAHLHHFNADEQNMVVRVGNGSLMGTDDFAMNLRLNSDPSQTLIISTPDNVVESIHKVNLL